MGASMGEGYVSFVCRKDNKRDLAIAGKALRLLRKIATNRLQTVRYPSMETIARCEKGSIVWLGQDAIRWCREDPNRMLNYDERARSEEHTSELQSLMRISYAVFCLKKKTKIQRHTSTSSVK